MQEFTLISIMINPGHSWLILTNRQNHKGGIGKPYNKVKPQFKILEFFLIKILFCQGYLLTILIIIIQDFSSAISKI